MSQASDTAAATLGLKGPFNPAWGPRKSTRAERALGWFEARIWHNYLVCSNCFSKVKRRYRAVEEKADGKQVDIDDDWRTPDATLGEASEFVRQRGQVTVRNTNNAVVGVTAREPARGTTRHDARTTCLDCGSVRAIKQKDTVSKTEALDLVPRLVDRLREQGHLVDQSIVSGVVYDLKTDENHSGNDKEIFAVAAALGVDNA